MSEFEEARVLRCPYCKTQFCDVEGMMCSCEEEYHDWLQEMREEEERVIEEGARCLSRRTPV